MKGWNDGSIKRKIYDYSYNRSIKKIDKQNENKGKYFIKTADRYFLLLM